MKLDFIVAGFAKCGTTTICDLLGDHPEICVSKIKEPNFFTHKYDRGWQWFEKLFRESHAGQLRGDGSTVYSNIKFAERACERIAHDCPEVRLVFMVRDPVARAEAAFRELHNTGYALAGINAPYTLKAAMKAIPGIISNSLYWRNINIYRERFRDDQIHIMFLEDFVENPARELSGCLGFLGVDTSVTIERPGRQLNAGSTKMYDARMLRRLRKIRPFKIIWDRMNLKDQNRWGQRLRLRKRFDKPVFWSPGLRKEFISQVREDSNKLLDFCGKDRNFWNLLDPSVDLGKEVHAATQGPMRWTSTPSGPATDDHRCMSEARFIR